MQQWYGTVKQKGTFLLKSSSSTNSSLRLVHVFSAVRKCARKRKKIFAFISLVFSFINIASGGKMILATDGAFVHAKQTAPNDAPFHGRQETVKKGLGRLWGGGKPWEKHSSVSGLNGQL